eukprot:3027789-Heterocapsa_arctica.AAC.1
MNRSMTTNVWYGSSLGICTQADMSTMTMVTMMRFPRLERNMLSEFFMFQSKTHESSREMLPSIS